MGSPKLQKDPYFHDKFGDPYIHGKYGDGVPIFTGSPNSYDNGKPRGAPMAKLKKGSKLKKTKDDDGSVQRKKSGKSKMAGFKKSSKKLSKPRSKPKTGKFKNKTGKDGGKDLGKKRVNKKQSASDTSGGGRKVGTKRSHSSENDGVGPQSKKTKLLPNKKPTDKEPKQLTMRRERETSDEMKETIKRAKNIWERLRRHDLEKNIRTTILAELMELIKDNLFELVRKHDTARILQCMLRFGNEETRTAVFVTLKDHVVELSKLKYAKFVVKALFKYCNNSQRGTLISLLYNNVVRLVKHTEASEIVELAYNDYANALQRAQLVQEFYGPQFALFKDNDGRGLGEILTGNPDHSSKLIGHMKQVLLPLMNKSVVKHSIIHKVLLDFLLYADNNSRSDIIEGAREVAVEMLHTREGTKVALQCLWHGNAKDRKVLVKSFKGFVSKICKEEHGHIVMMGLFDCVDDTVLVTKTILTEMVSSLEDLCSDRYGRRVLHYLLGPRSSQHFSNQFVQILAPGDDNAHSKKPQDSRWAELRSNIAPSLIELASDKALEWACQKPMAPLLIQIAASAGGDATPIYKSLAEGLETSSDDGLVCDPCGHWVLKKLIANETEGEQSFANILLSKLSNDRICKWTESNRGCFVLSSLLTNSVSRPRIIDIIIPLVKQLEETEEDVTQGMEVLIRNTRDLN